MLIDQISVFVENKSGRLSDITGILSREDIDIRALSIADTTNFGILRLIVDNPEKAENALKKGGLTVSRTQVVAVRIEDKPGSLFHVLEVLKDNGISVEYAYAFITRKNDDAYVILRVEDNEKAVKVLSENGVALLPASEVYAI
jgi:hypothetical protein